MRGILLAGGTGSRLWPATQVVSKQLLPVFDKPMIYYPLSTLMIAGIREILVVTTRADQQQFRRLLGDGSHLGLRLSYAVQEKPEGIAQAFLLGADFVDGGPVALILGDNIFHGSGLGTLLRKHTGSVGGRIFASAVDDSSAFGVVELDVNGTVLSIEEKPSAAKPGYAVPGLYFYDHRVVDIARELPPSERGELEITAVNEEYLRRGELTVTVLDQDIAWMDAGTFESMAQASDYVRSVEARWGLKIGCVEEIAWRRGYIDDNQLRELSRPLLVSGYGRYLLRLLEDEPPER